MRLALLALTSAVLAAASSRAEDVPAAAPAPAPAAAPSAAAQASAPSAHLAAAQRLYQKLDLDAALAELQQAELAAKDNEDETVSVLIYRGLIYSDTGKAGDANDQFKRALAMRPWAEVPPETSPRIAKMFSDARKSIWGMASVKPPQKKVPVAPPAANTPPAQPAQPAVPPGK
jgi:tetratricopeptide (TPR) repeat protein